MRQKDQIYENIKKLRREKNITQKELAKKMSISRTSINYIEQGKRNITTEELVKFCNIFNCSYEEILNKEEEQNHLDLYKKYTNQYKTKKLTQKTSLNPIDEYLSKVNPYYYPSNNINRHYE